MKVQEFIEYMTTSVNRTMKDEQVLALAKKQLEVKKYLPINEKKELVDKIVAKCVYFENGTFRIDSIDLYMYFTMMTIDAYTNLEIDDVEICFDILSESGMMPVIIAAFGQEYQDVQTFLNMKRNEILENNSLEMQLGKFFYNVLDKVEDFVKDFIDTFNNLNINKDNIIEVLQMFVQQ